MRADGHRQHRKPRSGDSSVPTSEMCSAVNGRTSSAGRNRDKRACREPSRHTCATTGAVVRSGSPASRAASMKSLAPGSSRSTAISTTASRITAVRRSARALQPPPFGSAGPVSETQSSMNLSRARRRRCSWASIAIPCLIAPDRPPNSEASSSSSARSSSLRRTVVVSVTPATYHTCATKRCDDAAGARSGLARACRASTKPTSGVLRLKSHNSSPGSLVSGVVWQRATL